jgi:cytochrome o ubiquinol oxidase subunit 3
MHTHTEALDELYEETFTKTVFGFWLYLMTDCLLFGTLFCAFLVLRHQTFGGPSSKDIFDLTLVFSETMILLLSSLTCGLALLASLKSDVKKVIGWLIVTFILGSLFLGIELFEFKQLIDEGNSFQRSAFLSSYFTLVGTHGLHITFGLLWLAVLIFQLYFTKITLETFRRLVVFNMFWHFLDLVWIFIFTFVYLNGVI